MMHFVHYGVDPDCTYRERFDTLFSPNGGVAALSQCATNLGIENAAYDGSFPGNNEVRDQVIRLIEVELNKVKIDARPLVGYTVLSYNAEQVVNDIDYLRNRFSNHIAIAVGGQLVSSFRDAESNPWSRHNVDYVCEGDAEYLVGAIANAERNQNNIGHVIRLKGSAVDAKYSVFNYDHYYGINDRLAKQNKEAGFMQLCVPGIGGPGCSWAMNNNQGACSFCALQDILVKNNSKLEDYLTNERLLEEKFFNGERGRFFDVANQFLPVLGKKASLEWLDEYSKIRKKVGHKSDKYAYLTVGSASDEDVVRKLRECGISEVYVGIEHFDSTVYRSQNKQQKNISAVWRALDNLKNQGVKVRTGLVLGVGETVETMKSLIYNTLHMASSYSDVISAVGVNPVVMLPGSAIFNQLLRQNPLEIQDNLNFFLTNGYLRDEDHIAIQRYYIDKESPTIGYDGVIENAQMLKSALNTGVLNGSHAIIHDVNHGGVT